MTAQSCLRRKGERMCSEWKVTSNCIAGETVYAVYRQKDVKAVDHSGNREYATEYMSDRQKASEIAAKLNSEENPK